MLPTPADGLVARAATLAPEAAEAALREALELEPRHARALLDLARILAARGDTAGALELLERVSPPSPLVGESERLAAELRMRTDGAGDQAALRARIAADPADLEARLDLGRTLAALGKHEDALAELLDVVRRDRHFADDGARKAMVDLFGPRLRPSAHRPLPQRAGQGTVQLAVGDELRTAAELLRSGQGGVLLSLSRLTPSYYRVCFLGTATATGLLRRLAPGTASLDQLAGELVPAGREGLEAWLDFGVSLGLLRRARGGYTLRGRLTRALADPTYDPVAALFEEIATLHHRWIAETPLRLREERPFSLDELPADLVARSSLTLEPFVREAVRDAVPVRGPVRLLEIGCGSGQHIRTAAERNPELRALGVDLAPAAVALARDNIRAWGLEDRVQIEEGDVRLRTPDAAFDLATLHNNIYYFPVESADRAADARARLPPARWPCP